MFGGALGFWEMLIILIAGVIIFGKQLPDVGRSLGKTFMEFKKGLRGLEETLDISSHLNPSQYTRPERSEPPPPSAPPRVVTKAPKFQDQPVDSSS